MIGQGRFLIQKLRNFRYFGVFFVAAFLVLSGFVETKAQDYGRVPITVVSKGGGSTKTKVRTVRVVQVKTVVKEVKTTKIVPVKTSNLIVTTQVGAKVIIEQIKSENDKVAIKTLTDVSSVEKLSADSDEAKQTNDDEKFGAAEFEGIAPGLYRITSSLDGYDEKVTTVEIEKEKTSGVPLPLEPFTFDLTIETNLREGEVRFAQAKLKRKVGDELFTEEISGYCIALIDKNGVATINGLKKGYYNIDIRPSFNNIDYETRLAVLQLPNNLATDATGKTVTSQNFRIELEKKISDQTFSTSWTNAEWSLPNGWQLGNTLKTNRMSGVALPKEERFRYYADFEMVSDVTSVDGNTVGFIFRAQNDKNYYLVQISGEKAAEPFVAKGFVVSNGQAKQIFTNPISHFAKTIAAKKSFRLIIKAKKNLFEIYIEDSETGDRNPVGNIVDQYETFRKGAVGIAVANNSNFEVATFSVCPKTCP